MVKGGGCAVGLCAMPAESDIPILLLTANQCAIARLLGGGEHATGETRTMTAQGKMICLPPRSLRGAFGFLSRTNPLPDGFSSDTHFLQAVPFAPARLKTRSSATKHSTLPIATSLKYWSLFSVANCYLARPGRQPRSPSLLSAKPRQNSPRHTRHPSTTRCCLRSSYHTTPAGRTCKSRTPLGSRCPARRPRVQSSQAGSSIRSGTRSDRGSRPGSRIPPDTSWCWMNPWGSTSFRDTTDTRARGTDGVRRAKAMTRILKEKQSTARWEHHLSCS